jgi:hypothetical protein
LTGVTVLFVLAAATCLLVMGGRGQRRH